MKITIRIRAQYFYNSTPTSDTTWKPKGSTYFTLELEEKDVLYMAPLDLKRTVETMVNRLGNNYETYSYLSHVIEFDKPTVLTEEAFNTTVEYLNKLT